MPLEGIVITGSIQWDCLLAAAAGAMGNRLHHWYQAGRLTSRTAIYAFGYVLSGGVIGFFFGVYFGNFLVALIFGGVWPVAAEAREAAQTVIQTVLNSLKTAGNAPTAIASLMKAETDEDEDGSNSRDSEGREDRVS